tara:strand:+ start:694 stop:1365 length:672 start_codon:yes stop_codon:yes gene_type:complete
MKLSIIIPVYNEVKTLEEVINKVKKLKLDKEIVVVDDGSEDGSRELLKKIENIKLILHEKNYGKGKAVRTGLDNIEGDVVVIQDADLEYDPTDFVKMFDEIKNGEKVVYGSRFLEKFDKVIIKSHYFGNKFLSLFTSLLFFSKITDMETCYKMFRKEVMEGINLKARGFDLEPEITSKILKRKYKIKEVPISYNARDFDEGKKITWRDGVKAGWYLLKYRFVD